MEKVLDKSAINHCHLNGRPVDRSKKKKSFKKIFPIVYFIIVWVFIRKNLSGKQLYFVKFFIKWMGFIETAKYQTSEFYEFHR